MKPKVLMYRNMSHLSRGVALLEFLLSALLFLMLVFGIILWALTLWQTSTMQYAVERGARCAILPGAANERLCQDATQFAANNAYGLSNIQSTNFTQIDDLAYSATDMGSNRAYPVACVKNKDFPNLFSMAADLTKADSGTGTNAMYCRSKQR